MDFYGPLISIFAALAVLAVGWLVHSRRRARPVRHACGHRGHGGFPDHRAACRWLLPDRADMAALTAHLRRALDLDPEQSATWDGLVRLLHEEGARLAAARAEAVKEERAPAALARAETVLAAGLRAVGRLRPALEGFYGTLSEAQRRRFDALVRARKGRAGRFA